jgi:hypothetical protein
MKKYWAPLTKGYVRGLVKIKMAVIAKGENHVHPIRDCKLTQNERNNLTKLRFNAMIAKSGKKGYWLLTRRGSQFLRGKISVPREVLTWRNQVVDYSPLRVFVKDVLANSEIPEWPESFAFELAQPEGILAGTREVQLELFG